VNLKRDERRATHFIGLCLTTPGYDRSGACVSLMLILRCGTNLPPRLVSVSSSDIVQ